MVDLIIKVLENLKLLITIIGYYLLIYPFLIVIVGIIMLIIFHNKLYLHKLWHNKSRFYKNYYKK